MASCVRPDTRAGIRRASSALPTLVPDQASSSAAAPSAEMPSAVPRKPDRYDISPITPAPVAKAAPVAAAKAGRRSNDGSSMGAAARASTITNSTRASTATATSAMTPGRVQPWRPSTSAASRRSCRSPT